MDDPDLWVSMRRYIQDRTNEDDPELHANQLILLQLVDQHVEEATCFQTHFQLRDHLRTCLHADQLNPRMAIVAARPRMGQ